MIGKTAILSIIIGIIFFSLYVAPSSHPDFKYSILGSRWKGELFSGMTYQFHSNKKLYKIQFFQGGEQVGTEHRWYSNGVKWQEIQYQKGKLHGTLKAWYRTGKVKVLKHFLNGKAHGEFWGWHANGVVSDYHIFKAGRQIIYKSFIRDGKPFYNFVFDSQKTVGLKAGRFCKTKKL